MNRFRLSVAYDGTHFSGWGVQPDQRTIQGVLGEACHTLFSEVGEITAAGRTDAGVHAACQTVHLDVPDKWKAQDVRYRLNALLPEDVVITDVQAVSADFHARYHCLGKQYVYKIANTPVPPLFDRYYVHWEKRPLSMTAMREGAKYFEGKHNFKAFMNVGREMDSTIREIIKFKVKRKQNQISLSVTGTGFLYNQVRIMVGTLIDVGLGKKPPDDIAKILASGERQHAGQTAPASGLWLQKTIYQGDKAEGQIIK